MCSWKRAIFIMMFFLIFSLLLSLTINLVTIYLTKNVYYYDFETPLGLELDPNWKIEEENGNNVLVGVGHGYAKITPNRFYPITKENDRPLPKTLLPSLENLKVTKLKVKLKLEEGSININFRESFEKYHLRYLITFEENFLLVENWVGPHWIFHMWKQVNFSLGEWHSIEVLMEDAVFTLKLDGEIVIEFEDGFPIEKGLVSFETCPNSTAKIDDVEIHIQKPDVLTAFLSDLKPVSMIFTYPLSIFLLTLLISKISFRYAFWIFLGTLSLILSERPTLFFSREFGYGFLIAYFLYSFTMLIFSSLLWRKGKTDLYSIILAGLIIGCLLGFGKTGLGPGALAHFSLLAFTIPLILVDSFILKPTIKMPEIFTKTIYSKKLKTSILGILILIFSAKSAMGMLTSPLSFHLSLIALIGEVALVYLLALIILGKTQRNVDFKTLLPNEKEWKIITVAFFMIYVPLMGHLAYKAKVPLNLILLNVLPAAILTPIFLVLLRFRLNKNLSGTLETIDLSKHFSLKKPLLIFFLLTLGATLTNELMVSIPITIGLMSIVGVILIIMVTLDTWKMAKSQQKLSTI